MHWPPANQWTAALQPFMFTVGLNSAKVSNREFNWPVFGVRNAQEISQW